MSDAATRARHVLAFEMDGARRDALLSLDRAEAVIRDLRDTKRMSDVERMIYALARAHATRIGQQTCEMRLGPLTRVRAPARATRRGRTKVRIDAITPVVICRDGKSTMYTAPTTQHLGSTLRGTLAPRLGIDEEDTRYVRIEMLDRETQPETVMLGSHWGNARGWVGHVTADVNASGLWLLECAARGLGLGAMTGVGFGRIKLTTVGGEDA